LIVYKYILCQGGKDTNKKSAYLVAFFLIFILFSVSFTGCIQEKQESELEDVQPAVQLNHPSILPAWEDGEYHNYYGTKELLNDFNEKYPDLVHVYSIGKSVLGKDIWCIRITNEKNDETKSSCLIDGCIHGIEWEAGEACLYLAEYLLINFDNNKTITHILNTTEIYIVPLVNPDGRQNDEFNNDNGVDLNRNFNVFFGRLRSPCIRLGKILGKLIGPVIKIPFLPVSKWPRNCGRYAFSEPESQALSDLMKTLDTKDFSFYVNCHTAWHNIMTPVPWSKKILNPPYIMTEKEIQLFDDVKDWVEENTEYEADRSEENTVGGCTDVWVFNKFRIPAFVFEILSWDYDAWEGEKKHDHLVHWMKTTLPFFMYLLMNVDNLRQWKTPDIQPPLPEGIPPTSLS